jgi:integrase
MRVRAAKETRRTTLNDRILRALKPPPDGKPYDVRDTVVPGLRVRVVKNGQRSFVLLGRFPGAPHPTRRALGAYGAMTLAAARQKAQAWIELTNQGIDPTDQEKQRRLAEQQKRKNSFAAVAEDFIADKLPSERKGREVEQNIRQEFIPAWGPLPITEITDLHVIGLIKTKKRTAPAQARNLLGLAKRLFRWAVDQRCYGLKVSPCGDIKPLSIIGERSRVERILSDEELFALWRAVSCLKYPAGPAYQLLILTALRLNEVADAHWSEFDLKNELWIIPAQRMKGKNSKARPHAVPLTAEIKSILAELPRFNRGKFLFSTTWGEKPVWISNKVKDRIDARMLRTLRAIARLRGEDAGAIELAPWTNHDIRRSVRSNLSRLRIAEEAREAVLAHVRSGIKGTYDLHDYLDEKREALELWAARLRSIVNPPPANVVGFRARAF